MTGKIELWGGVECTVNRVGDRYFDQLSRSGHRTRDGDLERIAALGFSALRFPVLWETPEARPWADAALGRLRSLGVRPIATLCHHGSGPPHTSLADPSFAEGLAAHAREVARAHPWIEEWTPVNEPLTTARFSGLYGLWYPHGRDDQTFLACLLHQCRAIVLAMREIRAVNPRARLVQTEDFGETFGTPRLASQIRFENQRRLLSLDLLAGRVDRQHPMWDRLRSSGIDEAALAFFLDNPCLPEVIGLNYYLTSDRLIDERRERYPAWSHGGNGHEEYADVEAVRAWGPGISGHRALLERVHRRYQTGVALAEVHLGCSREEQLRWVAEAWRAAHEADADVRAVTIWSLLGAFDWNSLVTQDRGFYEPGAFDVRGPQPRATALARLARELADGAEPSHPVLATPGWWRRPDRFTAPAVGAQAGVERRSSGAALPIVIAGARGTLGRAFSALCRLRGLDHVLLSRDELDIAEPRSVAAALARHQPWAVVNAAGYVRVDEAETDLPRCERENTQGPAVLAAACAKTGIALVTFSSDLVFDGKKGAPYLEDDPVGPLGVYGRTKALAEAQVLAAHPAALVVRTSAFFGPWDEWNFVTLALSALARGQPFRAAGDLTVSPTYVPDLVSACLDLLVDGEAGLWHLANQGQTTWADFAKDAAKLAGRDPALVEDCPAAELGYAAPRPAAAALGSKRGALLPGLADALRRYVADRGAQAEVGGGRAICGGGDACLGDGRCRVHRKRSG